MDEIDRRRVRALSSERRAGSWLHRRAVEQQYRFLRENPRVFVIMGSVYVAVLPLIWLQAEWVREFALGAWTASVGWLLVLLTWQLSGVGHLQQGELAEQWTVQELRPLTRSGNWTLINHVLFRPWDIDHVLIGPAGVVVIETKGGNSDWTEPRHEPRIQAAVRQATDNAGDTRRFLRPDIGTAPVHAVVALWPARETLPSRRVGTATVLSGHRLREWVESLPVDQLDSAAVGAAWQRIADHLERRDASDLERLGRPPRRLTEIMFDAAQYPVGLLVGAAAATQSMQLHFPWNLVAMLGVAAIAVISARRIPRLRPLSGGVALGIALLLVVVAVLVVQQFSELSASQASVSSIGRVDLTVISGS